VRGATATASVVASGRAAGCRAIDLRVPGGIDLRLLPDRGLDAGAAWFGGLPLAWTSALGETAAVPGDWVGSFGGGLLVTCGLRNVGAPSEGHGQHGAFTFQPAEVLAVEERDGALEVRGRIVEASALGHHLEVRRTWRTHLEQARVELRDVTRNLGREVEAAPLLYHVNLGAPLWAEGSSLALAARATHPRDAAAVEPWDRGLGAVPGAEERVFEHEVAPGPDGWAAATVRGGGVELELRWDVAGLPRLWQWVHPAPGLEVLGLEPANCSVLGRGHDRAQGRLPELAPGETRITRLVLRARGG
jgi:Domain of unknown function (DUF4432)